MKHTKEQEQKSKGRRLMTVNGEGEEGIMGRSEKGRVGKEGGLRGRGREREGAGRERGSERAVRRNGRRPGGTRARELFW